ncbi:hypothetical protein ACLX1H_007928 [Fusarium chlamydosporum]
MYRSWAGKLDREGTLTEELAQLVDNLPSSTERVREILLHNARTRSSDKPALKLDDVRRAAIHWRINKGKTSTSHRARDSGSQSLGGSEEHGDELRPTAMTPTPIEQVSVSPDNGVGMPSDNGVGRNGRPNNAGSILLHQQNKRARTSGSATWETTRPQSVAPSPSQATCHGNLIPSQRAEHLPHALSTMPLTLSMLEQRASHDSINCSTKIDEIKARINTNKQAIRDISNQTTTVDLAAKRTILDEIHRKAAAVGNAKRIFEKNKDELLLDEETAARTAEGYNEKLGAFTKEAAALEPEVQRLESLLHDEEGQRPQLIRAIDIDTRDVNQLEGRSQELKRQIKYYSEIGALIDLGPDGYCNLAALLAERNVSLLELVAQ